MKKHSWFFIFPLILILFGCASRDDVIILDNRISSLQHQILLQKDSVDGMQNSVSRRIEQTEKKVELSMQPVHQNQANTITQIETLKTQIEGLQGRLETLEYNQKKELTKQGDVWSKDLKELLIRLQKLEQQPSGAPSPQVDQGNKPEKTKEMPLNSKEELKGSKETVKEKEKGKVVAEEVYEEALAMLKKQAFEGAQKKFEEYLKMDTKGKYVEDARFGLAESLYWSKNYEEAVLSYQKLIKSFPKSKQIPEALYKQALSFISLKDPGSARLLLEKIVKSYPKSIQAKAAQKKIKSL